MHLPRPGVFRSIYLHTLLGPIAGALVSVAAQTNAATINAASPSLADVTSAVSSASDGDTVIVPAGTADWTSVLKITKGITLQGATTVSGTGTSSPTANDLTIIQDDSPLNTTASGLIQATMSPTQSFRLTGFTFIHGTRTTLNQVGAVRLSSSGFTSPATNMRVDHCHFNLLNSENIVTSGWVYGVADHNWIQCAVSQSFIMDNGASYGGYVQGHGAWADYPWFGTNKFFFVEDSTIVGDGQSTASGSFDSEFGGRWVVRHCFLNNSHVGWHGTEGQYRGCRAVEMYDNTSYWTYAPSASSRSGTSLIHDNTWTGTAPTSPIHTSVICYRETGGTSVNGNWNLADGTSPWDVNDTEGNGTYVEGHAPYLFESGTAAGGAQGLAATGSASLATVTDSTKHWTVNQWAGYSVTQENPSAASYLKGSIIISNSANTITYVYYAGTDRGPNLKFAPGDAYQIHRVLTVLDQTGRGKGDLVSGNSVSTVINTVTDTKQWPHQALEPAMSWNNVYTPTDMALGYGTGTSSLIPGVDYYNLGAGFTADTSPSTVSSTYVAALNGVDYTGPFVYPHPLVSGVPTGPTNLRVAP